MHTSRLAHQPKLPEAGKQSIGAAAVLTRRIPAADANAFHTTVANAFVHSAAVGLAIPACAVLLTAIAIYRYLPRH